MRNILVSLFYLIIAASIASGAAGLPASQPLAPPGPTPPPATASNGEAAEISAAIRNSLQAEEAQILGVLIYKEEIQGIKISIDERWAIAWLGFSDPQTGEIVPGEPGLALVYKDGEDWTAILPSDPAWPETLKALPIDLISEEAKQSLLVEYLSFSAAAVPEAISGYYLPWEGGTAAYVSQTTLHDKYTTNKTSHYAFDFYIPQTKFPILAAKAGTVWRFVDTVADRASNDYDPIPGSVGNYLILQDTTTSPATYQLYLHLSQFSIPAELKRIGAVVHRGQFIGRVDNTGQSYGHHLHYQVHTNPDSYWGRSVDITFDDVLINGGRPRVAGDAPFCFSSDLCSQFQTKYISGNISHADLNPPEGKITAPKPGYTAMDSILHMEGTASDVGSGLASAQFIARYQDEWHDLGTPFYTDTFSLDWDMCAAGVPAGPVTLALRIQDKYGNHAAGYPSLRPIVNNASCPPPPSCSPNETQAALFAGTDYQGACTLLNTGTYSNGAALGAVGDNQTTSILLGAKVRARLYTEPNLKGHSEIILTSDLSLANNRVSSGTLSSLVVEEDTSTANLLEAEADIQTAFSASTAADISAPFSDTMENGLNGWSIPGTTNLWDQTLTNNPNSAGTTSWYYGQDGRPDYNTGNANRGVLDSPAIYIPMDGKTYYLRFWYQYETESAGVFWDQRRVQISTDGGETFTDLVQLSDDPMNTWLESPAFSLADYAGETIQVRFLFDTLDSYDNSYQGWYLDDFSITNQAPPDCSDTGDTLASAIFLQSGAAIKGEICPNGDIDFYKFQGAAGERIGVVVDAQTADSKSVLDSVLLMIDGDGVSPIAQNDDQVPQLRTDSWLSYQLTRSGEYYLKVRAWNHPSGGSKASTYTLRFYKESAAPTAAVSEPMPGHTFQPGQVIPFKVSASDPGSGISHVIFYWHSGDWTTGKWIREGEVWTSPGGSGSFTIPDKKIPCGFNIAMYAEIYDWAGNVSRVITWDLTIACKTVFLPVTRR